VQDPEEEPGRAGEGQAEEPGRAGEGQAEEPGRAGEGQAEEPESAGEGLPRKRGWLERKSMWTLRRDAIKPHDAWIGGDQRDNDQSRLPADEKVHLGGLVLVEAFTPSTISALYDSLTDFPNTRSENKEWISDLTRGRSAAGRGGWTNLGMVRRPGDFGFENFDPELPEGVDAIWPYLFYPTPSLTLVVATFTLAEPAGDLSILLRADYHSSAVDVRVHVPGRFGKVRSLIPWARPATRSLWYTVLRADDQKRLACEALITAQEAACWKWMADKFPGRFSIEAMTDRPTTRLIFTEEQVPFKRGPRWLSSLGLGISTDVWRSPEARGWAVKFGPWTGQDRTSAIAATRRVDAAKSPGGDLSNDTNWYLTQRFADEQSPLIARWAIIRLLSLYTDRLAALRDQASKQPTISRPVRDARALDNFLMRDGLDASTITSDLEDFTQHLEHFRFGAPEYMEDMEIWPETTRERRPPYQLLAVLMDRLITYAHQLDRDTAATITNINVSAGLRQAIANTIVQRRLLILTIVAIGIAILGIIVAVHPSGH
jgi:hypothetical protein